MIQWLHLCIVQPSIVIPINQTMKLSFTKSINQKPSPTTSRKYSEAQVREMVSELIRKTGLSANAMSVNTDGEIEINDVPDLKMHSLMLRAEELGLDLRCTKKTVIEIC